MPVTLYQLAKTEAEKQTSINKLSTSIPVFNEGGIRRVLHFPCKFLHQVTLVTCPCVVFLIGVRDRRLLLLYTSKCASRHNVVHFFNSSTSKSAPSMVCFDTLYFQMCFAPQRRVVFEHLNFQKSSELDVLCTFSLPNVLRATRSCTFSTSQLPKAVRT